MACECACWGEQKAAMCWGHVTVVAVLILGVVAAAVDIERTYGIFGAIQQADKPTTAERLLEQCYAGFALNGCEDLNVTAGFPKAYAFAQQFLDPAQRLQQYCLQCCTRPVPRLTGADETWNLSCPLNNLQRLSVSKGQRTFRFARRDTLADDGIIQCDMPSRTPSTYLAGYSLTLWLVERTSSFGTKYWRSVVNCTVAITETTSPPEDFNEVLRLRSIPTPQSRPTWWIAPTFGTLGAVLTMLLVPLYRAGIRGERCLHCGSWLLYVGQLCVVCMTISCSLHPPPPKIYVENGDPNRESTEEEDEDDDDEDDEEDASGEDDADSSGSEREGIERKRLRQNR